MVLIWILIAVHLFLHIGAIIQVLMGTKDSDSRLAWLFALIFVPGISMFFYLLAGINYSTDAYRKKLHEKSEKLLRERLDSKLFPKENFSCIKEEFRPLAKLMEAVGEGNKVYEGNSFEIIITGARKRELLLEELAKAKKFILIEYFRFGCDRAGTEVKELLMKKVAEGVEVCLLNNNFNSLFFPRSFFREMKEAGIKVIPYTSIRYGLEIFLMRINYQNHRKIVVIDGKSAFTGGMNLNDNYFYHWRDTHIFLEGPLIHRLTASFMDLWLNCDGTFDKPLESYFDTELPGYDFPLKNQTVQAVTDAPECRYEMTRLGYEWILNNAKDYIYIQTPYFLPPNSFLDGIKSAALRGVDVRLMLPLVVDTPVCGNGNRAYYKECLEAGVRIFERGGEFIHSKTLVADDYISIIGGTNLDERSFFLNTECNCFIYAKETALACKEIFLEDKLEIKEVKLESWLASRKWYQTLASNIVRTLYRIF